MTARVWVVLVLLLEFILGLVSSADFTESICLEGRQEASLTLSCPEDQVIRVDDAVFGQNRWGSCIITEDDCVEKTRTFLVCDGQTSCTHTFKTFTKRCGYSTMLLVGYTCIRVYKEVATPIPVDSQEESSAPPNSIEGGPQQPGMQTTRRPKGAPRQPDSTSGSSDDDKETGLIVGCVIASLVTVVVLIIAIVMVVRRLMQPSRKDRQTGESSSGGNCDSFCITMDCLPCCRSSRCESPREKSHDLRMRKTTAAEAANMQDQSKLRIAPVGQESSSTQSSAPDLTNIYAEPMDSDPGVTSTSGRRKSNPEKPPRQKHPLLHGDSQDKHLENLQEKVLELDLGKMQGDIYANDNTLPSSANKNLMLARSNRDTSQKKSSNAAETDEKVPVFDAVALPNTYGGTAC